MLVTLQDSRQRRAPVRCVPGLEERYLSPGTRSAGSRRVASCPDRFFPPSKSGRARASERPGGAGGAGTWRETLDYARTV